MPPEHYYGDIVRRLFLFGAVLMLFAFPLFSPAIPVEPTLNIIAIVLLSVMAGLTNPRQKWTLVIDIVVSIVAFAVPEYYAITFSHLGGSPLFVINQFLAFCFLIALYFSVKSARNAFGKPAEKK